MYDSLQPHGLQHARLPCPLLCPRVCSNSCPLSQWCHPAISFSAILFSSCPQSFPASGSSPKSRLFISSGQFWNFSFSTSPSNEYSGLISFRIELVWSSCHWRDSQESFSAPQFESINCSALSLLYGLTLTSVLDYWKNHSFDYMHLCQQSGVSAFFFFFFSISLFLFILLQWVFFAACGI